MTATTTERTARRPEQQRADQPPARGTRRRLRTPAKGAAGLLRLAGLALGLALALGGSTQAHGGAAGTVARCEIAVNRGVDALVAAARDHTLVQTRAGLARRLGSSSVPYRTITTVFAELRPVNGHQPAQSGGPGAAPYIATQCARAAS